MGRSLGSLSALELASHYRDEIKGLIIESGFLNIVRILISLDLPIEGISVDTIERASIDMAGRILLPTLVIHGEHDTLVPLQEAHDLVKYIGSDRKELVVIPKANHNNIMYAGFDQYFDVIEKFVRSQTFIIA